jgi:hypothetical protein
MVGEVFVSNATPPSIEANLLNPAIPDGDACIADGQDQDWPVM